MNTIICTSLIFQLVLTIICAIPATIRPKCSVNQIFKQSGFDCWTCRNYRVVRCALITTPQCFCLDDYVHHDITGKCIPKSECPPPVCGKNEIYAVGPDCQTCSNYAVVFCLPVQEKRCICKSGYYRHDITGICTKVEDCPVCPPNQTFTDDGSRDCQTCSNWQLIDCVPNNTPGCYCNDGYVHTDTDKKDCIAIEDCPKTTDCTDNEHYSESGYDCLTCQDIAAGIWKKCIENTEAKCYCDEGFTRDTESGKCRSYDECKVNGR